MKILIVNRLMGIRSGGGEYFDYYIARELEKIGNEVKLVVGKKFRGQASPRLSDVDAMYISTPFLRDYYHLAERSKCGIIRKIGSLFLCIDSYLFERKVFRYIKRNLKDFDIVQLCGLWRLGYWIEDSLKIPTSIIWHGVPPKRSFKYAKHCSLHVGIGVAYEKVKEYISPNAVELEPGVDTDFFIRKPDSNIRKALGIDRECVVFIFAGRLIPVKNLPFLLEGFSRVLREHSAVHLLIVGDGPEKRSLIDLVERKGMCANVTFAGNVPREEMVDYYSTADAFVMTSKYESFPLVLLEAMSCSLPVIVPSTGCFAELIKDGQNGKLVDVGDINKLKEAFLFVINDGSWRKDAGEMNRCVAMRYSWAKSACLLNSIYGSLEKRDEN